MNEYKIKYHQEKYPNLDNIETRWCYSCNKVLPLNEIYFTYANKEHTRFRNKCRKCTNWDSMISHRIHRIRDDIMEGLTDERTDKIYKKRKA